MGTSLRTGAGCSGYQVKRLAIGAESPEEIVLSIMAEIVAVRRQEKVEQ
jgi:hypothetical protein